MEERTFKVTVEFTAEVYGPDSATLKKDIVSEGVVDLLSKYYSDVEVVNIEIVV